MAEFIRTSYVSLHAIPEGYWYIMHQMYEDSDLDGANEVEAAFDFIEKQVPGSFVGILANDSVTPPCCNSEGHYHCDHYNPYWYTVLVAAPIWEQYKAQVEAKHQAYVNTHQCREK